MKNIAARDRDCPPIAAVLRTDRIAKVGRTWLTAATFDYIYAYLMRVHNAERCNYGVFEASLGTA